MFAGERPTRFYLAKEEPDLSMDPVTGMIRIRVPLDRETRDKYVLSVEARNGISTGYCQVLSENLGKRGGIYSLVSFFGWVAHRWS